ncbi:MAG TPA: DUF3857 domain-containing protein [Chitinophaga sp.]|uniref:DUF3857 domain-containing protein n=1 Tax=Chitinophaga sp. TaxID=1869181 RepID=UPI002DBB50D4|nr:DUF3857 domain-containing protein [Chitinophaga sp.]HEU4554884.1 DUF3857 domain-containing protein [Chitinophaga sp.]
MKFFLRQVGVIVLLLLPFTLLAGDYEKAWDALHHNDVKHARELLLKAIKNNVNRDNAVATLIMLETYDGIGTRYLEKYPDPLDQWSQPESYVYALWFNYAILGEYGKKKGKLLANLERLSADTAMNGSIRAAANYFKGYHLFYCQQQEQSKRMYPKMGALEDWQFAGPFDNISGSGFNKEYPPVKEPASGKGFISYNNAPIDWFTPLHTTQQGWVFVGSAFPASNAVGYAQTYVLSDQEQDALLCLGGNGALKVWLNDKLMLADAEERATELDFYKARCHLHKGYNRVLVQIGFTDGNNMPNFIVRLTDEKYNSLPHISSTSKVQAYQPDTTTGAPQTVVHFAEDFFRHRMEQYPQDPAYACLLSKVYVRNQEYDKAKAVMHKLYLQYPDDPVVLQQYSASLSSKYDRTEEQELDEKMKVMAPENYWVLYSNAQKLDGEKKYAEELEIVNKMVALQGPTELTDLKRVAIYAYMEKLDSTVALLKAAYERYPDRQEVVMAMEQYYKSMLKDPASAVQVMEKYIKDNYSYQVMKTLAQEYFEQNQTDKGIAMLKALLNLAPYETASYDPLAEYFFSRQQYDSAIYYLEQAHGISPYSHRILGEIATCYQQKNDRRQALAYYQKALVQYAGGTSYRRKIRELEKKPDVFSYFPKLDTYEEVSKALKQPKDTTKSYYYIFDEKNVVLYPEGANEQMISTAVYINNNDGIDRWKEISVPYNSVYQDVSIIKAEVIKANGARVPAETYDNQIVYTKLENGDAIYYNYKISSYGIGRLGREYWDKFYFSASVPTTLARYSMLIAKTLPIYYVFQNSTAKPVESEHENFHMYTWEMKNVPAFKRESYMPNIDDIGQVLHVSTVKSWDVIAEWYSDLTRMQCREDFDLNAAFSEIFPKGAQQLTDWEKAKRIYEYIEEHIAYSSVSFRQGAYVPQRASKTLNTRLGDCKDLSALFVAFARKAGMDANLMLVSTRENGRNAMLLPSLEFNHCVVRFKADNEYHCLELTNNQLPFNALPQSLVAAQVLNIPFNYNSSEKIALLPGDDSRKVSLIRKTKVVINGTDQRVTTTSRTTGELASLVRSKYAHKTRQELTDDMQSALSQQHKNPVVLDDVTFTNLENLQDTVTQEQHYTIKNDVISVGDFSMIKPIFTDLVATPDIFTAEARQYPFEYWSYENTDQYATDVDIELPEGKAFDQVPGDIKASFNNMTYQLSFQKTAPNKLQIKRRFSTNRNQLITATDFDKMKSFFNTIVAAEQKYISFK